MTLSIQTPTLTRARHAPVAAPRAARWETSRIEIVENPLHRHDGALATAVEEELRRLLRDEGLGEVQVRFRVCRDGEEGFRFICKVENPPRVDTDVIMPWRWWSPLMQDTAEFAAALEDGLRIRRERLSLAPRP